MRVLVANLGSTSFKFKLIDTERDGEVIARGAHERIGHAGGQFATHGDVIDVILKELPAPPDAIGFKAVHGGPISGAVRVTPEVIFDQPLGTLFVHIFAHKSFAYPFEVRDESDWMAKYFFTGGIMPSDDLLLYFQKDLHLRDHWHVDGRHYSRTSEHWLRNMDRHRGAIELLLAQGYGESQVRRWWVYWRVFFMSCAELWGYAGGREWLVSHYLFAKRQD